MTEMQSILRSINEEIKRLAIVVESNVAFHASEPELQEIKAKVRSQSMMLDRASRLVQMTLDLETL